VLIDATVLSPSLAIDRKTVPANQERIAPDLSELGAVLNEPGAL
jgi:hypothetical protein